MGQHEMSLHTILGDELGEVLRAAFAKLSEEDRKAIMRMNDRRAKYHTIDHFGLESFLQFILVGLHSDKVYELVEAVYEKERGKGNA